MASDFDIGRFARSTDPVDQYQRQLKRLRDGRKETTSIEKAVEGAVTNLAKGRSFVIYGEPQSGKTEMMICLTGRLLDEGHSFILHLLNDSVDLLDQNLGRFKSSGLAPAAKNFSEVLDPAVKIKGQKHVVFCKKNGKDLRKLIDKVGKLDKVVIVDDEADYASPNSKINAGSTTPINDLINQLLGANGKYIGVTATPARLDLNNTFENDSALWVDFPPHSKYTGQNDFFPLELPPKGNEKYILTLLPDSGSDPKYARQALFSFLANVAYLNVRVNDSRAEQNFSLLVHTSGKKVDHKSDWDTMHSALDALVRREGSNYTKYTEYLWQICKQRFPDADPDRLTRYVLDNISRNAIIILNSERDWSNNATAATNPTSLFTIIIGGNIVSRGVTLNNLLGMFFTRDVKHKIQQDTYIQRARMFGSRGEYLRLFELTIPNALFIDWHRCFVFHRLALDAIREGLGSLVWLNDHRITAVASASIDKSTIDLDRGEMSFSLFRFETQLDDIANSGERSTVKLDILSDILGNAAFPDYLKRYIKRSCPHGDESIVVHPSADISNQKTVDNKEDVSRKKGFMGKSQLDPAKYPRAIHHLKIFHNAGAEARLFYKFIGTVQFIKNTKHDS